MNYVIGKSNNLNPEMCVQEATAKFRNPKLILFFSPVKDFAEYTALIHKKFPDSISMGATTIATFGKDGADKKALQVVGIESGITCSADVLEHVDKYPIKYVDRIKKCVSEVKETRNTICLEYTTAFLCAEESVLATLNSVLLDKNIQVFGGTAGDDGSATGTLVALNGKICENSTVFALIHNEGGAVKVFRENIYEPVTGHVLTATKTDSQTRTVYEYNHKPAVKVYAEELGVSETQVGKYFDTNPMGRYVGTETFITANCALGTQNSIVYHARIYDNSKTMLLKPADYRAINDRTIQEIKDAIPNPSFAIMCNCLARTLLFEGDNYLQDFAKKMGSALGNYVGFSGYGEQTGEYHFNQTLSVAVFE